MNIITTLREKYKNFPEIQLNTGLKKNTREDIFSYSEQGFSIIPLYKYTKKASLKEWTSKDKITRADIYGRSHPGGNIGLRLDYTYSDGTFLGAIDIESSARKEVLTHFIRKLKLDPNAVPWTKTQSGAMHLYFRTEKEFKPIKIKDENMTVVELRMGRTQQNVLGPSTYREIMDNGEYERFKNAHIGASGGFDTSEGYEDLFQGEKKQYETYGSLLDVPFVPSELITLAFEELGCTIRDESSPADAIGFESKELLTEEQLPRIFQYCKYASALKAKIAQDEYLDHEERIWLANILKPFGSEVIHSYFQNMEDYDRDYTQKQIESLKHSPSLCPALRGSNSGSDATNVCRYAQCMNIRAIGKKSPIAFAYQSKENIEKSIELYSKGQIDDGVDDSEQLLQSKCENYFSYQTKVNEAAIVGDKFFLESIGSDKFLIRVGAHGKKEEKIYYDYLVKHRHILGLRRIDYIGDISLTRSAYTANLPEGVITVKIKGIDEKVRDNEFIEDYLQRTFGGYKDFIKKWLAVYCYTNYQDLPTLILTGPRGTGKNTFAEMIYEIFPTLSAIAKDISGSFNPNAESKLLIIDESDSKGKVQYQTLKSMSGSKYVEVNKKYVPQYQVWNNLNIIFMSNEDLPIHVERDEMPTDEANNQFFVYSMKPFQGVIDPELDKKLNERIGYYIRTELKAVFDSLDFRGYRYSIPVPITEDEKKLFENSMSEEEILSETIIDDIEKNVGLGFWEYAEFIKKGFIPTEYIDDKLGLKIHIKQKVISKLKKLKYLTNDKADKIQADKKRLYCYKLGAAWYERIEKVPVHNPESRHSGRHFSERSGLFE